MPTTNSQIILSVTCKECGKPLRVHVCSAGYDPWVEVWPCESCISKAVEAEKVVDPDEKMR
jgi:hypothetical protein